MEMKKIMAAIITVFKFKKKYIFKREYSNEFELHNPVRHMETEQLELFNFFLHE